MARNYRSRNAGSRGRGRSRNGLLVRESSFTTPVQEPANFREVTKYIHPGGTLTVTSQDVQPSYDPQPMKMRVSSIVVSPWVAAAGGKTNLAVQFTGQVSGNKYLSSDVEKPMKIRFSNTYGSDGQWYKKDTEGLTINLGTIEYPSDSQASTDAVCTVSVRIVWVD